jgi:hypothetical protein
VKLIGTEDLDKVLAMTDRLGLSRERVWVPVIPHGAGSVDLLASGEVQIVLPAEGPLDEWLPTLRTRLERIT